MKDNITKRLREEYVPDSFEEDNNTNTYENISMCADYSYGIIESLTYNNCYPIEEVYDYDSYEKEWN